MALFEQGTGSVFDDRVGFFTGAFPFGGYLKDDIGMIFGDVVQVVGYAAPDGVGGIIFEVL